MPIVTCTESPHMIQICNKQLLLSTDNKTHKELEYGGQRAAVCRVSHLRQVDGAHKGAKAQANCNHASFDLYVVSGRRGCNKVAYSQG